MLLRLRQARSYPRGATTDRCTAVDLFLNADEAWVPENKGAGLLAQLLFQSEECPAYCYFLGKGGGGKGSER